MGVPKFFRWISERYPKINQPFHAPPKEETRSQYFPSSSSSSNASSAQTLESSINKQDDKVYIQKNNILPEFDRLYLDMNGIIHCCSHNNAGEDLNEARQESLDDPPTSNAAPPPGSVQISEAEIFRNVCYYVDRIVTDVAKPKELVYMAIDGVAPRAKMNQQRSRRYRSGKEKEIESTFQKAHLLAQKKKMMEQNHNGLHEEVYGIDALQLGLDYNGTTNTSRNTTSDVKSSNKESVSSIDNLEEVEPGRFSGMFQTSSEDTQTSNQGANESTSFHLDYDEFCKTIATSTEENEISNDFHSNQITPGTPFFERCTAHLEHFIKRKLHTDPRWAHLTVIFSGPNVPGEGEHKIMEFIRNQKNKEGYNPNTRHCLFGQDGDLVMLGLATHEPHFTLLREEVVFDQARKKEKERRSAEAVNALNSSLDETGMANERVSASIDSYIHNTNFELLHMSILRDYLAFEFETKEVLPESPFELEPTIDDFVFMTFFVGNDFLPHMPAIDIADEAFDLLFYTYKKNRKRWLKEDEFNLSNPNKRHPYMTDSGEIVSGKRLERFLSELGKHEDPYYSNKKRSEDLEIRRQRKSDKKYGRESSIPPDEILAAKKEWDKTNYMEMLMSISKHETEPVDGFKPVSSSKALLNGLEVVKKHYKFQSDEDQDELEEGFLNRMGTLIRNSLSTKGDDDDTTSHSGDHNVSLEQVSDDLKGRYYYEKFHFSPLDAKQHIALRKAYIEGLVWNLKYYYKGCACWDWFYPYHYGEYIKLCLRFAHKRAPILFTIPCLQDLC
jgi:5'-3' exonuclease